MYIWWHINVFGVFLLYIYINVLGFFCYIYIYIHMYVCIWCIFVMYVYIYIILCIYIYNMYIYINWDLQIEKSKNRKSTHKKKYILTYQQSKPSSPCVVSPLHVYTLPPLQTLYWHPSKWERIFEMHNGVWRKVTPL